MYRRIRRAAATLVPAVLGLTLLAPAPASAEVVTSGKITAYFNYPTPTGPYDYSVSDGAAELIDLADSGTIRMGMFWLNSATIKDKLIAAQARGVTVKVVVEGSVSGSLSDFAAQLTGDSQLTVCDHSCLGNGPGNETAINHDKYMVLDSLSDGRKNVVWQSSQNLAGGQDGEVNNAVVVSDNLALADRYRAHHADQVKHAGDSLHTKYDYRSGNPGAAVEAFFFPRDTASDAEHYGNADILASFIDQVDCAREGRIRIASAELDQRATRPAIYDALARKKAAGCAVDTISRDFSDGGENRGINELTGLDIPAYGARPGGCRYKTSATASCNRGTIHSKYLLTEWKKADGTQVRHVYTGSHNWTKGALTRNDETLLRIDDPAIYQAFVNNFDTARAGLVDIDAAKYGRTAQHYSRVNVDAAGDQHYSAVASAGTADTTYTAVVYENGDRHDPSDPELGTDVYIRMYRNGVPLWDEKKLSNSGTAGNATWSHQKPDVGVDDNGNAIVVWTVDDDGNKYGDIAVRKVTPAGTVTSLPRPHASGDGDQLRPTVAVAGDGSYAVAWESTADGATLNQVFASSWDASGAQRYRDVQVSTINSGANGSNRRPDLAVDAAGNAAIVWEEDADGNGGLNIGLAELTPTGSFGLTRRVANSLTDGQQSKPAVAQTADGRLVAAWTDEYTTGTGVQVRPQRVYHRIWSAAGTATAAEQRTTPDGTDTGPYVDAKRPIGTQADADVTAADDGTFVVAWKEAFVDGFDDVWARGFNADGTTTGRLPATRMNVVTGGGQGGPAVTVAPSGRLALTYSDDYDQNGFNEMRLRDAFRNA
ncbi:MAG TPA: phospholipase D-like domain-containing protein [Streptomyces sp.]|uniref:phospholipase D-like domain-containing protein n=1 Tax=Streptomyces sp. TaxID=1931 RepID=UPI002D2CB1E9|nr:phospholipase D-like domain-containing protein [Streptomyces sp.]HZG04480.1 phospholipase D-like domain-containing protein [Streptomyces sp.]